MGAWCRFIQFRPAENFCTCNDWELNGICCHLLAARRLPEFAEQALPSPGAVTTSQVIGGGARYERPAREPLGDDPQAIQQELQRIREAGVQATQLGIQQRSNADPFVAEVRSRTNALQRCLLGMPAGESREECMEILKNAEEVVREKATAAGFQLTFARAGKRMTKKLSRPENRRKERALYPGRAKKVPLAAVSKPAAVHEFQPLAKKGRKPTKVGSHMATHIEGCLLPCLEREGGALL